MMMMLRVKVFLTVFVTKFDHRSTAVYGFLHAGQIGTSKYDQLLFIYVIHIS